MDDVLLAILNPMVGEDPANTGRPRAVLAALCLADEPNVSEENAELVLASFASRIADSDGTGAVRTSLDRSAIEVASSIWSHQLKPALIAEFIRRPPDLRYNVGGLWGMAEVSCWKKTAIPPKDFFIGLVQRLNSGERVEFVSAALALITAAYEGLVETVDDLSGSLLNVLTQADLPANFAAAWALGWLSRGSLRIPERKSVWLAKGDEVDLVIRVFENSPLTENDTRRWLAVILGLSKDPRALHPLLPRLNDPDAKVRKAVVEALVQLGDKQAVTPLVAKLDDQDAKVRKAVIGALLQLGDKQSVAPLLAKLDDQDANVGVTAAMALHVLGEPKGIESQAWLEAVTPRAQHNSITELDCRARGAASCDAKPDASGADGLPLSRRPAFRL